MVKMRDQVCHYDDRGIRRRGGVEVQYNRFLQGSGQDGMLGTCGRYVEEDLGCVRRCLAQGLYCR